MVNAPAKCHPTEIQACKTTVVCLHLLLFTGSTSKQPALPKVKMTTQSKHFNLIQDTEAAMSMQLKHSQKRTSPIASKCGKKDRKGVLSPGPFILRL